MNRSGSLRHCVSLTRTPPKTLSARASFNPAVQNRQLITASLMEQATADTMPKRTVQAKAHHWAAGTVDPQVTAALPGLYTG